MSPNGEPTKIVAMYLNSKCNGENAIENDMRWNFATH